MDKVIKVLAVVVSLVGLGDSVYLTAHHYSAEPVPCSIISGCETVLTSSYAEIAGIPLAAFGAAAYFVAFSLALLALYGNRTAWKVFGVQTVLMAAYTLWLIYVQAVILNAFCQYCLLSAISTFLLVLIFLTTLLLRPKTAEN